MNVGQIYVASSWRNEHQPQVVNALREAGFNCYDFRNPIEGDHGFGWQQCGNDGMSGTRDYKHGDRWAPADIIRTLAHPVAENGYELDFGAMTIARACVLVMPCGRSAHIEAGFFVGVGRPLHILIPGPAEPELMWRMAYESGGGIHTELATVIEALRRGICRVCGCTDVAACPGGCGWTDENHTLCTACIGRATA